MMENSNIQELTQGTTNKSMINAANEVGGFTEYLLGINFIIYFYYTTQTLDFVLTIKI